ncbi:Up-regulated during septation-domain-containing protein [Plectosphaerella plurivora]|uniref:Up-regulated during septation-domain-containing protein n=1 Tax=Plectosphaerella plurivora TaxID=936078 RepID=A0A9P8V298_9PEZI|nr:Up-regulated during septation-domain-containing protein [Plectosphaerella plurivora]
MNPYTSGRDGYGPGRVSPPRAQPPSSRMLVDGYARDVQNNFAGDTPRFNPMNTDRPQSSPLVDLKDPIQVHLLTETALSDSKTYEILSQEEVDDLKKQISILTQRVQQARSNLKIQTKYRDAAISMSKLYSPGRQDGGRRKSLLGRSSGGESAKEAEKERQSIERKCEELASELWTLEKRLIEPQRRLLEHTAGVLQLTHKAGKKTAPETNGPALNGIPGSPESMYTFTQDRNSRDQADELFMDDPSFFPTDMSRGMGKSAAPIEPPLKSPQREQNAQLREEAERLREDAERLREENNMLQSQTDALARELGSLRKQDDGYVRSIADTEQRLETLNKTVRNMIVKLDPARSDTYQTPPNRSEQATKPGETLADQFSYLERGLMAVDETSGTQASEGLQDAEAAAAAASIALSKAELRLDSLNDQLRELLVGVDPSYPGPPETTGAELDEQFDYTERSIRKLDDELSRAAEQSASSAIKKRDDDQSEAVLMGLWEIIQSGYADIRERKEQRRRTRLDQGLEPEDDDMSGDEAVDLTEQYSLPGFSTKVQWLYAQATQLKEQKSVLKRQIKQQRELNNKSDSEKDAELRSKQDEVTQVRELLSKSEQEATKAQQLLVKALEDAEVASSNRAANETSAARAQEQLQERDAKIAALETESKTMQQRVQEVSSKLAAMEGKTATVDEEFATLATKLALAEKLADEKQQEAEKLSAAAKSKEEEFETLNVTLIELKTELTICQAELDGAYGSRKQRAVEAAAVQSTAQVEGLKSDVDRLKDELAATLKELEGITAETIGAEREKLDAESRRRLEEELQKLRKAQGPGKSPLSPR